MKKKLMHVWRVNPLAKKILLTMRLTLFLMVLGVFSAYSSTYAQKTRLDLKVQNTEVKDVLNQIENQSEFFFMYDNKQVDVERKVDLTVHSMTIDQVLEKLFEGTGTNFKVVNRQILLFPEKQNSIISELSVKVSGKVTDTSGAPLPGVSVTVKGSTIGTITDVDGGYSLPNIPDNSILQFSFIGMKSQEVPVAGKTSINVTLEEETVGIEEVVAIGYGTQKKVTITGSVVSAKGDDIKQAATSSVTNSLVGRLPGLIAMNRSGEPGYDDATLLIRGNNTLGDNSPLIVVDGIADRAGGFSHIDVNDIESVTILKDASAAIYGSRAANGVILVTTKRGKAGKVAITYSLDYGMKSPTVLPKMLNAHDYAQAENEIAIGNGVAPTYTAAELQKFQDGSDPLHYPNTNFENTVFRKLTPTTKHNLSVSGGSERIKYFTSIGYQYDDNIYKNSASNYKQYSLRSNFDIQATKDFKVFANLSLREQDANSPYDGAGVLWRNIIQGDPTKVILWPNGKPNAVANNYNPLTATNGTTGSQNNNNTYINADLGFNFEMPFITKGLGLDGGLSFDKSNGFYKSFQKAYNLYTINNTTGDYIPIQTGPVNANLNENMNQSVGITENVKLRYSRTFNTVHNVSAFVGYEQYQNKYNYLQAARQNFVSPIIAQIFAGPASTATNDGTGTASARQNFFGRADYSYAEKYLFQFNWRYDGSENFPQNNRFGFFPAVSLGWRASSEKFWTDNLPFINYFKIRGSVGKVGNDHIQYNGQDQHYTYLTTYTFQNPGLFGGSNPTPYTGIGQIQTANPNVTWEVGTEYNLGFDSKLLNNAINIEFDLFKQRRNNILSQPTASVPQYAGLSLPVVNDATTESKGFEVNMGYTKTVKEVRFTVGGNFSYAHSNVVNINEPAGTLEWQRVTGKPIGAAFGETGLLYESIGIYRTQADLDKYPHLANATLGDLIFKDVNKDGKLDASDRVRLDKTPTPQIIYGINLNANYKGFNLSMLWQGAAQFWQYVYYEGGSGGIGNWTQDFFNNRWTPQNPNASGPKMMDRENPSSAQPNTYFLKNSSYLRLKNIELSYTLPQRIISKLSFSDMRIYLSGYNLLTFTGVKDVDPEESASNQSYAGWTNIQSKTYNLGLSITF